MELLPAVVSRLSRYQKKSSVWSGVPKPKTKKALRRVLKPTTAVDAAGNIAKMRQRPKKISMKNILRLL